MYHVDIILARMKKRQEAFAKARGEKEKKEEVKVKEEEVKEEVKEVKEEEVKEEEVKEPNLKGEIKRKQTGIIQLNDLELRSSFEDNDKRVCRKRREKNLPISILYERIDDEEEICK